MSQGIKLPSWRTSTSVRVLKAGPPKKIKRLKKKTKKVKKTKRGVPSERQPLYVAYAEEIERCAEDSGYVFKDSRHLLTCFNRCFNLLNHAKSRGFTTGLDYGCGTSGAVVIGKLLGLTITGLDADHYVVPGDQPYKELQKRLVHEGYDILNLNTNIMPWPFSDSQFDFIVSQHGLDKNFKPTVEVEGKCSFEERLKEAARIVRPGGVVYFTPFNLTRVCPKMRGPLAAKNIQLVDTRTIR